MVAFLFINFSKFRRHGFASAAAANIAFFFFFTKCKFIMASTSDSERKCEEDDESKSSEDDDDCDLVQNTPDIPECGYQWLLANNTAARKIIKKWVKLHDNTENSWKKLQALAKEHRIRLPLRDEMPAPGICGLFFAVNSQYKMGSAPSREIDCLSFHSLKASKNLLKKVKNSQIFKGSPFRTKHHPSPMLIKLISLGISVQDPKGQFHTVPFLRALIPIVDNIIEQRLQLENEWAKSNHSDSYMDGTGEQTFEKCHVVSFMSFQNTMEFQLLMTLATEQCIYKEFVRIAGADNVRIAAMGIVRLDAGAPRGAIHGDDLPPTPFKSSMF